MSSRGRVGYNVDLPMPPPLLLLLLLGTAFAQVVGPGLSSQVVPQMCDTVVYDPLKDTCCGGLVVVGKPFASCCGRMTFEADRQGCCNGQLVDRRLATDGSLRGQLACCGTVGYDPTVSSCCGNTVVQRSSAMRCCGGKPYLSTEPDGLGLPAQPRPVSSSPIAMVCCGCKLFNVTSYMGKPSCCDEQPYDTATQLCCNGAVHSLVGKRSPLCCGTAVVDETSRTRCCRGRPYRSGLFGPLCCPDGTLSGCCYYPQYNRTGCI